MGGMAAGPDCRIGGDMATLPARLAGLTRAEAYPHPVDAIEIIETHISWVLLTGRWVYKIKRPVDLGFVDFTRLAARAYYCRQEWQLNRRQAPDLYRDVVTIVGPPAKARIGDDGPILDYAVRMRQFPAASVLASMADAGRLSAQLAQETGQRLAEDHRHAPAASLNDPWGRPEAALSLARDNFRVLAPRLKSEARQTLDRLAHWTEASHRRLAPFLDSRRARGLVRECHGDLHLGNLVMWQGRPTPFDCIEFDPLLRWMDVIDELAFPAMDMRMRSGEEAAWRLVNAYLEESGDYLGVARLLPYFAVYRALVRAKVHALAAEGVVDTAAQRYITEAARWASPGSRLLVLTHGLSGSGKTFVTSALLGPLAAIRLRADVVRKGLFSMRAQTRPGPGLAARLYGPAANRRTYDCLAETALALLRADWPVIVDATFLRAADRLRFQREVAQAAQAPWIILEFDAPDAVLQDRLERRQSAADDASDADVAVMRRQRAAAEPLSAEERRHALGVVSDRRVDGRRLAEAIRRLARETG